METLVKWNALERTTPRNPGQWKSLIQGNPWYREIIHTRGTPRKYKGESLANGNQLYKEASYIWKLVLSECLIQQRSASTSEPLRGIKCTFEHIKSHRENQRNQNNQRDQGNNYQKPSRKPNTNNNNNNKQTFRPMSAKVDMGLKVLVFLVFSVFPMVFDSFCLDLFGCLGFFGFPCGFWYFQNCALYA